MSDGDNPPKLEDLNLRIVRAKNDEVDDRLSELESEVDDLEADVSDKEAQIEEIEQERDAAKKLLSTFRDDQREEQLKRIRAVNDELDEDDQVDISAYEEADLDVVTTVADTVEKLAEKAGSSGPSSSSKPDLSNLDPNGVEDDGDVDLKKVAQEAGLSTAYERVIEKGEPRQPMKAGSSSDAAGTADILDELTSRMEGD